MQRVRVFLSASRLFLSTTPRAQRETSWRDTRMRSLLAAHNDRSLPLRLVELGAGTASKTCILLEAALRVSDDVAYVPVDVSSDALELACQNVACALPEVRMQPVVRNYVARPAPTRTLRRHHTRALHRHKHRQLFAGRSADSSCEILRAQLQTGDALLLGTDMVKDEPTLLAAYDDNEGITAAFNLNILRRLNRELGANFDANCFRHRALWNSIESRIEMHLESTQEQDVSIEDAELDLHFMPCETIHTENSYKFTDRGIRSLLRTPVLRSDGLERQSRVGTRSRLRACESDCGGAAIRAGAAREAVWPSTSVLRFGPAPVPLFMEARKKRIPRGRGAGTRVRFGANRSF